MREVQYKNKMKTLEERVADLEKKVNHQCFVPDAPDYLPQEEPLKSIVIKIIQIIHYLKGIK